MIEALAPAVGTGLQVAGALGGEIDQEHLFQARQMQALSLGFHIILVCFGVAFPAIVLFMEALWLRTGDPLYRAIAVRWSKAMLALFAIGVVSGTILSFELGMLWPEFMATFGEVFGFAFALEGFSFFLEAIFITIYVYGWNRIPGRIHLLTGVPIVITGITGSLFVIAVNGWMNSPTGFDLVDGEVVNVDPVAALFNDHLAHQLVHMLIAGYMVAGFTVADNQPVKLAAMEGLLETTEGAPFTLGGWYVDGRVVGGVEVPYMLSLLAFHDPDATVPGLEEVSPEDRPPVNVVRTAFATMVTIGTALALLSLAYLLTWWRRGRPPRSRWFYRAALVAGPAAIVALIAGWIVTEVGRQPWIVYEVMRVEEAVTNASGIPVGYGFIAAVYAALAAAALWMLRRLARSPLDEPIPGAETMPVKEPPS